MNERDRVIDAMAERIRELVAAADGREDYVADIAALVEAALRDVGWPGREYSLEAKGIGADGNRYELRVSIVDRKG